MFVWNTNDVINDINLNFKILKVTLTYNKTLCSFKLKIFSYK